MLYKDIEMFLNYLKYVYLMIIFFFKNKIKLCYNYIKNKIKLCYNYIKNKFYDYFFGNSNILISTPRLFESVLDKCYNNSQIMDFGCGNGIYYKKDFIKNKIINKNLKITAIDIDIQSVNKCNKRVEKNNLSNNINVLCENILNYKVDNKFDYIIFTESLPLINKNFLKEILVYMNENLIKENGKIIFINNLVDNEYPKLLYFLKPYLKFFILIDFGRTINKDELEEIAKYMDKKIEINLINKNKINELSLFNLFTSKKNNFIYKLFNKYIINLEYDIKQYEIILG